MTALFFILVTLILIIVQTVILPSFSIFFHSFDLLIVVVLFLSMISEKHWIVLAYILLGAIMDSISGVPFFFHIFSYLWMYVLVFLMRQLLFKRSFFFIVLLSGSALLIQQMFLLFCLFVKYDASVILNFDYSSFLRQFAAGIIIIPSGFWAIQVSFDAWNKTVEYIQKHIARQLEWYSD